MEFLGFDVPVAIGHPGEEHVVCVVRHIATPDLLAAARAQGFADAQTGAWLVGQLTAQGELALLHCLPRLSAAFDYATEQLGVVSFHEAWDAPRSAVPLAAAATAGV